MVNVDKCNEKDILLNGGDVGAGAVPFQHLFMMGNSQKRDSFTTPNKSCHVSTLQMATSAAMAAGRRSEASAALVMKTFPRPTRQAPILPAQTKQIGAVFTTPSTMKPPLKPKTIYDGQQCKTSQPTKQGTKKPKKKRSSKPLKKRKVTKGRRSSWNIFYKDFVSANLHIPPADYPAIASKEYKLLTEEEKAHYEKLAEADRFRGIAKEGDPIESQSPPSRISPALSNVPSNAPSLNEKQMKVPFLHSCFRTRPPIDPVCTLPFIETSGLQDARNIGKTVSESSHKQGKHQVPHPPPKYGYSHTVLQTSPCDVAKYLMHEFLNQYGLFWPFQFWLLHLMEAQQPKINPHSSNHKGTSHEHTSPIHMYYQDQNHPFRKFFHPCSSKYLPVLDNLSYKLATDVQVLEEFRKLACDVALSYHFFRDALHYVIQNADAKAFQPLLGLPDCYSIPNSEAIYKGN